MACSSDVDATFTTCPKCGENTLRTDRPVMNALSRTDNRTYVCSSCGTLEALEDFLGNGASKENWLSPDTATVRVGS